MERYSLGHLSDRSLLGRLTALVVRDRQTTADLVAHLGEVEGRRLYRAAGYPSMVEYCVGELHLSEPAAWRRVQVARAARRFPAIFDGLAEGRLNLTSVLVLRPFLRPENVDQMLELASHRTKSEIEHRLAERFGIELAPERVGKANLKPISKGYYELRVVVSAPTVDRLRHAQDLMSHQNPTRNFGVVMDRLLDLGIPQLEKQKCGAADRPRAARTVSEDPRSISYEVRRAVWKRDGGRCVFVGTHGRRCDSRHQLEYDHLLPVAKGGTSTVGNVRLLCRAHNRLAAESAYGRGFMERKIEEAQEARAGTGSGARGEARGEPETTRAGSGTSSTARREPGTTRAGSGVSGDARSEAIRASSGASGDARSDATRASSGANGAARREPEVTRAGSGASDPRTMAEVTAITSVADGVARAGATPGTHLELYRRVRDEQLDWSAASVERGTESGASIPLRPM